ncbi:hypothetical protein NQ314_003923 [Rhamnusium bicolor]|uniref:Regulator of microtubule dynamics protein 1 n=1 Tax=Rhamnusium bicolor TaxID=1586634 RepID=A0AAV8ZMG8_9CUCU|nr:hypothetical protein NQ314_003923 [Rhamnusium bicolor]
MGKGKGGKGGASAPPAPAADKKSAAATKGVDQKAGAKDTAPKGGKKGSVKFCDMPLPDNFNAFLGAAVLGVISAAGMYLVEHYRQEKNRHAMAKDLARLDHELAQVKRELGQLLIQKKERTSKFKRSRNVNKANSVISTTTDDYLSASNLDSSDLEFYDVSDDEPDTSTSNLDNVLNEIDKKIDTGNLFELDKVLEKLEDLCIEYPENHDLLWRIGKAHHKICDKSEDKGFIQEHVSRGVDACSLALQLKPDSAEVHKWKRISDGYLFKKHVDEAIAINPDDPSLHHMLGRFSYEAAGLKWYERKVAAALFAEPPNATYAEALAHFVDAEKLANFEWKENKLMIAKCKIAVGDFHDAMDWLEKASNCKQGDGLDDKIDSEVKALLEKYNSYR